jgi:branched-chain amino acid transport system permease protein
VDFASNFASILLGGISAGTVLFIVSVGLSVTMGLMGFVNLAHGAFAMFGGYVIVLAMNRAHVGFTAALAEIDQVKDECKAQAIGPCAPKK